HIEMTPLFTPHVFALSLHDALPISYLGPGLRQAPTTRAEAFHPCRLGLGAGESVQFRYVFTRPSAMLRVTKLTDYATVVLTVMRSEEHTSELQSRENLVCRLQLEKK